MLFDSLGREIDGAGIYLGKIVHTPAESEFAGVLIGIKHALEKNIKNLIVYTDYRGINTQRNNVYTRELNKQKRKFNSCKIVWIKRTGNKLADSLAYTANIKKKNIKMTQHNIIEVIKDRKRVLEC